jgi:hypothetical protein
MKITKKENKLYDNWWKRGGKEICEISKERSKYVWLAGFRIGKNKVINEIVN